MNSRPCEKPSPLFTPEFTLLGRYCCPATGWAVMRSRRSSHCSSSTVAAPGLISFLLT